MTEYKTNIVKAIRQRLSTDPALCVQAMEIIHKYQVCEEYASGHVLYANNMGFTPADAKFLTSLCDWKAARGGLTPKQMVYVVKLMPKYARQLFDHWFEQGKIKKTSTSKFSVDYKELFNSNEEPSQVNPPAPANDVQEQERRMETWFDDANYFNTERFFSEIAG